MLHTVISVYKWIKTTLHTWITTTQQKGYGANYVSSYLLGLLNGYPIVYNQGQNHRKKCIVWKSLTVKLETNRSYCSMTFYPMGMFGCTLLSCFTEITCFIHTEMQSHTFIFLQSCYTKLRASHGNFLNIDYKFIFSFPFVNHTLFFSIL